MLDSPIQSGSLIERIAELERDYVEQVLRTGFSSSHGAAMTSQLERAFADRFGVGFAIAFVNGTSTMHAALVAAGVSPGDEVIVPPLTMASTTFVVLQAGAVPVFADVDRDTFQINADCIVDNITPRTKAIIPVALFGLAPELDRIMSIARAHNLSVIEDDAETMFSTYKGKLVGSIGDMSSFSFQSSKHITSGEGGMLITDDEELAFKVRRFSSLGYAGLTGRKGKIVKHDIQAPDYARHAEFGFNYRMPELCAAVALAQFERADELVARRIETARLFLSIAKDCHWLVPQLTPAHCTNTYWSLALRIDDPNIEWRRFRDTFRNLGGDGIYATWRPTYLEPMFASGCPIRHPEYSGVYQDYGPGLCPVAEALQPRLLQFKTNYWDWNEAEQQAEILYNTICKLS